MTRRQFSCEFKREACQLVTEQGVSIAQAARDLDLHQTVLRRWVRPEADAVGNRRRGRSGRKSPKRWISDPDVRLWQAIQQRAGLEASFPG